MSKTHTSVIRINNDDIARYLGVGDDVRRAILRHLGLPKRRQHAVSELWAALGLEPIQPEEVQKHLVPDPDGKNRLWDAARVAEQIGCAASTVNGYCANEGCPSDFPMPLLNFSRKTRIWLPLEVRAYVEPSIYGDLARQILRKPKPAKLPEPPEAITWHGTLQPLPPSGEKEEGPERIEQPNRIFRE